MDRHFLDYGKAGRAEERVVRLINVHEEATPEDIRHFFRDLNIVDFMRDTDPRRKIKHVVYVLFSSVVAKDRALNQDGQLIHGRRVAILPARSGYRMKEDQSGFVRVKPVLPFPAPSMQLPAPSLGSSNFPPLGSPMPSPVPYRTTQQQQKIDEEERRQMRKAMIPEKSEKCIVLLRNIPPTNTDYDLVLWLQAFLPRAIHRSGKNVWMLFCHERNCKNLVLSSGFAVWNITETEVCVMEWPTIVPPDVFTELYKSPRDLTENMYKPDETNNIMNDGLLPLTGDEWFARQPMEKEIGNSLWDKMSKNNNSGPAPIMSPDDDDDDGDVLPLSVLFPTTNDNIRQQPDQPSNLGKNTQDKEAESQDKGESKAPSKDKVNIYDKAPHTFGTREERAEGHRKYLSERAERAARSWDMV